MNKTLNISPPLLLFSASGSCNSPSLNSVLLPSFNAISLHNFKMISFSFLQHFHYKDKHPQLPLQPLSQNVSNVLAAFPALFSNRWQKLASAISRFCKASIYTFYFIFNLNSYRIILLFVTAIFFFIFFPPSPLHLIAPVFSLFHYFH